MIEARAFFDKEALTQAQEDYAYVDDPDVQSLVIEDSGHGELVARFGVFDMRCAGCANTVERAFRTTDGVDRCNVNFVEQRAEVVFDPERVTLSELFRRVADMGYRPEIDSLASDGSREEYRAIVKRLGLAGIGAMQVMMFAIALYAGAFQGMEAFYERLLRWSSLVICTPIVLYSAQPFFRSALYSLRTMMRFSTLTAIGMDVPIALAIATAYLASVSATLTDTGEVYYDSVAMFTFFLLTARFLESNARRRLSLQARHRSLLPPVVTRLTDSGAQEVPLRHVAIGELILVRPGAVVPVDGTILEGESEIDQSLLSGESTPLVRGVGARVFAGTTNRAQPICVRVDSLGDQSRLGRIAALSRRALADKPRVVALADTAARYFVLGVLLLAAVTLAAWLWVDPARALWITLAVLVVSCPCALSVATPAALTAATGALASNHFVITRPHVLEALTAITHVVFDKTGTLTSGESELIAVKTLADVSAERCTAIAAALEAGVNHPIARAFDKQCNDMLAEDIRSHVGAGVEGRIGDVSYRIGNAAFIGLQVAKDSRLKLPRKELPAKPLPHAASRIYLSGDGRPLAAFSIGDHLRPGARELVHALIARGLSVSMLSGDAEANCARTARALGGVDYVADATPESKLAHIEALQRAGARVLVVGDGLNDVPILRRADVSIAVSDGLELVQANADAIVSGNDLSALVLALHSAHRTRTLIRQNLMWAAGYNLLMLPLAVAGWLAPWLAALGMSTSSLVVTMNAMRTKIPWKY